MKRMSTLSFALLCLSLPGVAFAQESPGPSGAGGENGKPERSSKSDKDKIKSYDEVIKEDYETSKGLFSVHRGDDKVFFEIPSDALGLDMLWVTQIAETQAGFGYGGTGVGNRVVRWELRGEDVLLRDIKFRIRSDDDDSVQNSVKATSLAPIIKVFPIKAWGKDKAHGDRRDRLLHRGRPARVQRQASPERLGRRQAAHLRGDSQGFPREHRDQGPDDLQALQP